MLYFFKNNKKQINFLILFHSYTSSKLMGISSCFSKNTNKKRTKSNTLGPCYAI